LNNRNFVKLDDASRSNMQRDPNPSAGSTTPIASENSTAKEQRALIKYFKTSCRQIAYPVSLEEAMLSAFADSHTETPRTMSENIFERKEGPQFIKHSLRGFSLSSHGSGITSAGGLAVKRKKLGPTCPINFVTYNEISSLRRLVGPAKRPCEVHIVNPPVKLLFNAIKMLLNCHHSSEFKLCMHANYRLSQRTTVLQHLAHRPLP
jgi:hypothetical protein